MVEILEDALLNTLLGMGIVFIMLILIALVIWAFKFIPMLEEKLRKKNSSPELPVTPVEDITISESIETEDLSDDQELVAVITAAIYASMGDSAPVNGLVVRSIKKANRAAWLNA